MIQLSNALIDPDKVTAIWYDEDEVTKLTILFDNGHKMYFEGGEAIEAWKAFETAGDWRGD